MSEPGELINDEAFISSINMKELGKIDPKVAMAVRKSVAATMDAMQFKGKAPNIVIAEGAIHDEHTGEDCPAVYDFSSQTVCIGQGLLQDTLREDYRGKIANPAVASLLAAEETAHYIQDVRGRLPHQFDESGEGDFEHYQKPWELEAASVSVAVANKLFPKVNFSRKHQGVK